MLEINTIQDFQALPGNLQREVQKALRTKDRLDQFLLSLNKKAGQSVKPSHAAHWEECQRCKPFGHPGWVWKEQERDDNDIHPSQINKCLKFLWFSCNNGPDNLPYVHHMEEFVDPRLRLIFDLGHAVHDMFQRYGRMGAWSDPEHYRKEVKMDPDLTTFDGQPALPVAHQYWIRGSCDAVIDRYVCKAVPGLGDVAIRVGHEYKTINSNQYGKLTSPKPEHKFQATIYAAVFNLPIVVYLYLNKDTSHVADFPVPFDPSIWGKVVEKCTKVQHYTNIEQPPPWEETSAVLNPRECGECGFRKVCAPPLTQISSAPGRRFA